MYSIANGANTASVITSCSSLKRNTRAIGPNVSSWATSESGALIYPLYVPSGLIPEGSVPQPSITVDPMRTKYLIRKRFIAGNRRVG